MTKLRFAVTGIVLGSLLLPGMGRAEYESQGYVLDQPSFSYGSGTTTADGNELSAGVGIGSLSESSAHLIRLGEVGARVLPTPRRPLVSPLGQNAARVVIEAGSNEQYPQTQVRSRLVGGGEDLVYYDGNGQATEEAAAWQPAIIWREGVTIRGLAPGRAYEWQARIKGEEASVSEWSETASVTLGADRVGSLLPPALVAAVRRWLGTPIGETIGEMADRLMTPLTGAVLAVQLAAVSALVGQFLLDILARLATGLSPLLQLLTLFRKKSRYGEVIDGQRRQPVSGARVTLMRADTKTAVEQQTSDAQGRFYFTQNDQNTYLLRVEAVGFDLYETAVKGRHINRRVTLGVPLEQDIRRLRRRRTLDRVFGVVNVWRIPILVLGTALWFIIYLRDGGSLIWFGYYYAAAWLLEVVVHLQSSPYGIITDELTGQPVASAVIRFIDDLGRLAVTYVTSANGRFSTLLRAGTYQIKVSRSGYQPALPPRVRLTRRGTAHGLRITLRRVGA